ncbi:MAG: [protein-PII] uridylyltransferase [Pirellulaceae bacterium]
MTATSGLPEYVIESRQRWLAGKQVVRKEHDAGSPGKRSVQALSDLTDIVLKSLREAILAEIGENLDSQTALVLHGGCGRREFAPFSDIDLMLLYPSSLTEPIKEYAKRLSRAINDTGLALGFSVRTAREACSFSLKDAQTLSSLTESRFLAGNFEMYLGFIQKLQRLAQRNQNSVVAAILAAREKERKQYGETVYLLRPNIKRSRGALRDTHLIRWLGFVRFGETDIDQLCRIRAISSSDATHVQASTEFLLRVRCDLHFHANRAQDGLGRNEQVRIAAKFGYTGSDGVLPVEAMMQDYFRYTSQIRHISDQFSTMSGTNRTLAGLMLAPLMTRQVDNFFQIRQRHIGVLPTAIDQVKRDVGLVLRLMQLAVEHGKDIEHQTWLAIREEMSDRNVEITEDLARQFMALLEKPKRLAAVLRMLHEMRVLEKIIPAFRHARGLLQFNEYHQYTVDEHSLMAIQKCIEFESDTSVIGELYRKLEGKQVLHLALLLHDLGKGFTEEHCEVGRRIAIEVSQRLLLSNEEAEAVKFLVHNHLMMSHLAFHRDISDETMIAEFAANLGSVQMLTMLYLLTLADIAAVGPEMLTPWKAELLTTLFYHAREQLTGHLSTEGYDPRFKNVYASVIELGTDAESREWLGQTVPRLPWNYCRERPPTEIASQLLQLRNSQPDEVQCWVKSSPGGKVSELCITKRERIRSGIFYKVTGLLASMGFTTHSADIKPLGNSMLWYWFEFEDCEHAETPPERLQEMRQRAERISLGIDNEPPRFRRTWKSDGGLAARMSRPPIKVEIDNQTVDTATILDVFAYNKLGVLYTITQKIFELGLDVQFARIATYGHQVLDVFYVTDSEGRKIRNRRRLLQIRTELEQVLKTFLDTEST